MLNDYEEEMVDEMMKIEQYMSHYIFAEEDGFYRVDEDFLKALEYCINFMYNFSDIVNIEPLSEDEQDLNVQLILAKISYYKKVKELCEQFKEDD